MPDGILPRLQRLFRRSARRAPAPRARRGAAVAAATAPQPRRAPAAARPRTGEVLLRVRGLHKSFKGVQALAGVDVEVRRGEILGLLGPNGSGKSTFINVVSGHYAPTAGAIVFEGRDLAGLPAHRIAARRHRAHLPDPAAVRAPDACSTTSRWRRCSAARVRDPAAARSAGDDMARLHRPRRQGRTRCPDDLNLHQRKFLELARALASRPRLVLLDEVLCGLTPSEIDDAVALIRRIRDQGSTIVFVEHVMRAVMALTDRIVVLNHGELLAEGAAADVMQRPEVMTAYLGQPGPCLRSRDLQVAYGAAPRAVGRVARRAAPASCSASSARTAPARRR